MRSLQSREKTAAIIGNLIIESCLDPAANQKESGSYGIAQWSRPEETNLIQNQENVLRQRSTPLQTQLEYLVQDYQKDPYRRYNGGYKEFMATSSLEEATTFFMKDYLKPGIPLTNRRVTYAQWAMDQPWPSPTPAR